MPPDAHHAKLDDSPRGRLIQAATELFCQRGFNAVGVDAVVELAGTAKTTLYKVFGSKEQLVEAVLDSQGEAWRDWFIGAIRATGDSPRARLLAIFPVLRQWFRQKRFYGCPFINAVAEHDKTSDRLRQLALRHKLQVLAFIRDVAVEAGVAEPDRLTHEIALLIDGAIVAAMITKDPGVADVAQKALTTLLDDQLRGVAPALS
ncbi:MAG: TetR/AcrR family transcriptional regulator [Hyphomicrobiaceae bacterium]|nr:TetR/AcrR family transcriptional regulator [Hyphomicrobiaceae bacterium]